MRECMCLTYRQLDSFAAHEIPQETQRSQTLSSAARTALARHQAAPPHRGEARRARGRHGSRWRAAGDQGHGVTRIRRLAVHRAVVALPVYAGGARRGLRANLCRRRHRVVDIQRCYAQQVRSFSSIVNMLTATEAMCHKAVVASQQCLLHGSSVGVLRRKQPRRDSCITAPYLRRCLAS